MKAVRGTINNLPDFRLHILLTQEDEVIVARCLDFSVSSHGENEQDALASLADSLKDYLEHAIKHRSLESLIDPDDDRFWTLFRELELHQNKAVLIENVERLKMDNRFEFSHA